MTFASDQQVERKTYRVQLTISCVQGIIGYRPHPSLALFPWPEGIVGGRGEGKVVNLSKYHSKAPARAANLKLLSCLATIIFESVYSLLSGS